MRGDDRPYLARAANPGGGDCFGTSSRTAEPFNAFVASQRPNENSAVGKAAGSDARDQAKDLQHINQTMVALDGVKQQNNVMVEESTAMTQRLSHQASSLYDLVAKFRSASVEDTRAEVPRDEVRAA